jgi:histidinol-phosphate aminotransferase
LKPPPIPPHIRRLRPYVPGKPIEEVEREFGLTDVVKLASNENPLGPSPCAVAALWAALAGGVNPLALYPDAACHALTAALAAHLRVPADHLCLGNGSDEIIHFLGLAFLRPGDVLLTGDPSFVRYEAAAILNEAEFVATPLRDHTFDLDAMAERLDARTRLVFVANPNNPTGTLVRRPELERFLDRCPPETVVVLDEAYAEYVDDPDYPDGLDYVREGRNVVVLRTFSKIYALASLRVGYGVARPEITGALHQVREPFNVNGLAQIAALASLTDPDQVARSRRANCAGRDWLYAEFTRLGLPYVPTFANFVLVDVGRPAQPVFEALLRRGIIVRSGHSLGMPRHLRVTIGRPEDNARFVAALADVLEQGG